MSLIKLLSEAYAKSQDPDAIVKRLTARGWLKASQLGREIFDRDKATVPYAYCCIMPNGRISASDYSGRWRMINCSSSYDQFVLSLDRPTASGGQYWIIPHSEYTGELPPCSIS